MNPMRIAVTCPAISGHLNPSLALAAELKRRGHRVLLTTFPDAEPKAIAAGIEFRPVAGDEYPRGRIPEIMRELGMLSGFAASRFTVKFFQNETAAYIRELPSIWESESINGVVIDQCCGGAATAAQSLRLPYVTICNALWLSRDKSSPPWTASWQHGSGWASRLRNWLGHAPVHWLIAQGMRPGNQRRQALGLLPCTYQDWAESKLAVVAQQPPGFEFPEVRVPDHVHFTGPFHLPQTREVESFPFERLDGRPLIYVSLGTLQNRLLPVFHTIAAACAGLDAQLVIALGDRNAIPPSNWPGNPIIVPFAPQLELLQRAALVVTHAGLNTALESLAHGLPMVAIPIANDQPGVAARLSRIGAAEVIPLKKINEQRVAGLVRRVLNNPAYRQAALKMKCQIAADQGLQRAADIIEQALSDGQPVLRNTRRDDRYGESHVSHTALAFRDQV